MSQGVVIPWFDQTNFDRARDALGDWVNLLARAESHDEYRFLVEQELRIVATVRKGTLRVRGVARIDMDALTTWLAERRTSLEDMDAFEDFVDSLAERDVVVAWPPGRNDPCWCGSGTKYKRCCGALAINERDVADGAARLREVIRELAEIEDETYDLTIDGILDEFDEVAAELRAGAPSLRASLIDDLRYDTLGGTHYRVLLDLAARSTADDIVGANADLTPLLEHPLIAQVESLGSQLRLIYAEALHTNGRRAAALDVSVVALAELDQRGADVSATDRAIACTYRIETDGIDAAEAALERLLEDSATEDRPVVCEIAADYFASAIEYLPAATWGERFLRTALDADTPDETDIKRAAGALRRYYDAADSFADEHPGEPRPECDQALLDRAAAWLDAR